MEKERGKPMEFEKDEDLPGCVRVCCADGVLMPQVGV